MLTFEEFKEALKITAKKIEDSVQIITDPILILFK